MNMLTRVLLLALLSVCLSCTGELEVELQGTWRGQWTSGPTAGSLEVTFGNKRAFGDMTLYDVTLAATGQSCPSGEDRGTGDRTAAFRQDDVHFAVRMAGGTPGDGTFLFYGALNGRHEIDGSYTLTSDACQACTCGMGTSGNWTVRR